MMCWEKAQNPATQRYTSNKYALPIPGNAYLTDKYQTVMSKLLTPKIHTSSSSTKIPTSFLPHPPCTHR